MNRAWMTFPNGWFWNGPMGTYRAAQYWLADLTVDYFLLPDEIGGK